MRKKIAPASARAAARKKEPSPGPKLAITLLNRQDAVAINRPLLRRTLRHVLKQYAIHSGQINLLVSGHAEITDYKEHYFGRRVSTDVISFNLGAPEDYRRGRLECDLIINAERALEIAGNGPELQGELCLYAVHGLLHQLGSDDRNRLLAKKMHAREAELLSECGVRIRQF